MFLNNLRTPVFSSKILARHDLSNNTCFCEPLPRVLPYGTVNGNKNIMVHFTHGKIRGNATLNVVLFYRRPSLNINSYDHHNPL